MQILVVDDNAVNRSVAAGILEKQGHRIAMATNGREAVRMALDRSFDLILMDVQMPELDGFAATTRIRASEHGKCRRTPIVAMTARAAANDRQRCLETGMDDYVSKPVSKAKLLEVIGRLADISPATPEAASPMAQSEFDFCAQRLLETLDGDKELILRIAELFRAGTVDLLKTLREECSAGSTEGITRTAHTLRGSLGNITASHAARLAGEIEELARAGTLTGMDGRIKELCNEIDTIFTELERFERCHRDSAGLAAA